nr:unnamed protein product [Callosobruchus chinensis]
MLLSWIKGSPNRLPQKKALLNYAKRIAQYGNYKHDSHQYVSNIFLRKKQDGKMQMCFSNEITLVLEFLTHHFELGASYGTLNSYRSALDQILDPQIAQDYRIKRFFKGIYNLRSNCPNTPIHGIQNWSLISETNTIKNCTENLFITYKKPIRNATAAGWTQKSQVFANFYQRPLASK